MTPVISRYYEVASYIDRANFSKYKQNERMLELVQLLKF